MYGQWCELTLYKQHKSSSQRAGACVYVYSYYVCACFLWVIHHLLYLQYKAILQVNIQRDYSPQKHHNRTVVVTHSVARTHTHTHTLLRQTSGIQSAECCLHSLLCMLLGFNTDKKHATATKNKTKTYQIVL